MSSAGDSIVKTPKQLEKEAKKKAKLEKFAAKNSKIQENKVTKKEKVKEVIKYTINTSTGEKKDTASPLPASYSPRFVEAAWYAWWEKEGFFTPEYGREDVYDKNNEGDFVIMFPPPNVTGYCHIGHGLTISIEDAVVRWNRMHGKTTLWVPGTDHAGIATQVVVEKKIKREQNLSRHDIGREEFVKTVWKWKDEKGHKIYDQMRSMGASVDWNRVSFTMDDKLNRAVNEVFIRLHEEGLIYRDNRLVNWSCSLKSAISDIEVDKRELKQRELLSVPNHPEKIEFGVLVDFAYPVIESDEEIVVSTTRVETMLGDTAVAVHPKDPRYKHLHNKRVMHPFRECSIPIITDDFVEMSFGTGAVKITPAHDHNDFEVGKRHKLPFLQMMNDNGDICLTDENCKMLECPFNGQKRFVARKNVLEALKDKGLYRGIKDNEMVVPICSRSKDVVEPLLKPQWYVNCKDFAAHAIEVVKTGELRLIPDAHIDTWNKWLENIRPWCISRQLWWGHRIPAYYCKFLCDPPSGVDVSIRDNPDLWFSGRTQEIALQKACAKFNLQPEQLELTQDEDVLDTWFSSALFPFSVFGWPDNTPDLQRFYPGHLLETGHDIMFFWVARMVFMGVKFLGKLPFKDVYFHAMVRDAHGRKMSKSLGNVIDPLDMIYGVSLEYLHQRLVDNAALDPSEVQKAKDGQRKDFPNGIPECGADALRFALCAYTLQGRDINLDIQRVESYRHFCNKIWNAFKLTLDLLGHDFSPVALNSEFTDKLPSMDRWILSKLSFAVNQCETGFANYNFPMVTTAIYQFWLYELCDKYLEYIKPVIRQQNEGYVSCQQTLQLCVDVALKLLSPFMPFLTEELWQRLPRLDDSPSIHVSRYPLVSQVSFLRNEILEEKETLAFKVVREVRSTRANYEVNKNAKLSVYIADFVNEDARESIALFVDFMSTVSGSQFHIRGDDIPQKGCAISILPFCKVHVLLEGLIDKEKEQTKLNLKLQQKSDQMQKLNEQMALPGYNINVPLGVRTKNAEKHEELQRQLKEIENAIVILSHLEI